MIAVDIHGESIRELSSGELLHRRGKAASRLTGALKDFLKEAKAYDAHPGSGGETTLSPEERKVFDELAKIAQRVLEASTPSL